MSIVVVTVTSTFYMAELELKNNFLEHFTIMFENDMTVRLWKSVWTSVKWQHHFSAQHESLRFFICPGFLLKWVSMSSCILQFHFRTFLLPTYMLHNIHPPIHAPFSVIPTVICFYLDSIISVQCDHRPSPLPCISSHLSLFLLVLLPLS